ncbi:hypothetical protein [Methanoregula sp.]|uniref:hypothetical protein n=1 Tax=Methanoregula sp. TaxID=2052170 RepID=UPI003C7369CE
MPDISNFDLFELDKTNKLKIESQVQSIESNINQVKQRWKSYLESLKNDSDLVLSPNQVREIKNDLNRDDRKIVLWDLHNLHDTSKYNEIYRD